MMANELSQLITEPNRVTSSSFSLFDVLITSTLSVFNSAGVLSTSFSDHLPIFGVLKHGPAIGSSKHRCLTTRSIKAQNAAKFSADLQSVPWHIAEMFSDIDDK